MSDKNKNKEFYPNISNTASMSECTGLMPTVPEDCDELSSYEELYDMEIPKTKDREKKTYNKIYPSLKNGQKCDKNNE